MAKLETLTAYKCSFSYLKRNNPLIEEQREAIKAGENPEFTFSDFIDIYLNYAAGMAIGYNTDRAIALDTDKTESRIMEDVKVWHLIPSSGKQGKPVTVVKKTGKKYNFGSDTAALYEHHIFVYENKDNVIAVFHRQNGSGCKSVFLETANNSLREKGIKMEMELVVPLIDMVSDAIPTKIILQYTKQDKSSDVADNINENKKKKVIRELGLNLEEKDNSKFKEILSKLFAHKIDQEKAFALLIKEANDSVKYDDAEVNLRFGKRQRKVRWNDFENIMGTHDISDKLNKAYKNSGDFVDELSKLSDEYYIEIMKSEEV